VPEEDAMNVCYLGAVLFGDSAQCGVQVRKYLDHIRPSGKANAGGVPSAVARVVHGAKDDPTVRTHDVG
jgi:hypothetical protein